jgi:hypothetical protein
MSCSGSTGDYIRHVWLLVQSQDLDLENVSYIFYIMGRAIVIAVILQSDPSINMYIIACTDGQARPNEHLIFYLKERRESVSYTAPTHEIR